MQLPMAGRVQKNPVSCMMCASFALPDNVVVVPSRYLGDLLLAHRTYSFLFFPEVTQLPPSREVLCHFDAEAFFKIHFPFRVAGVSLSLDSAMRLHVNLGRSPHIY